MKKNLFKMFAVVMSVVMLCTAFSFYSTAFSSTVIEHYAPELDGCNTHNLLVNKSNTVAFVDCYDVDNEKSKYFYTTNGFSYWDVDFDSYAPKCDFLELAASECEGDTFVFLFYCYNIENVYDPDFGEYYEDYKAIDSYFLITKDFKTFEKCRVNVKSDTTIHPGYYYSFTLSGVFEYLNGEWVYANGDYIVTGKKGDTKVGKGVYYTTKDFKTWKAHYTHENVVWDGIEYGFTYFTNYGGLFTFNDYDTSEVYLLLNSKCYGPLSSGYADDVDFYSDYVYMQGSNSLLSFDTIFTEEYMEDETGEVYPDFRVVLTDLTNGKEKELYKGTYDFYYEIIDFNNRMYCSVTNWETGKSDVYEINNDYNFNKLNTDFDVLDNLYYYQAGSNMYSCGFDWIRVYKGNLRDGYYVDLTDANYKIVNYERVSLEINDYMYAFEIAGRLVILETNPNAARAVIYELNGVDVRTVGDTNSDGNINASDALQILQKATGLITVTSYQERLFDVDRNGKVQASDALRVLQYSTGLVGSLSK
ncbi:MAG: hypothetical protein IJZ88_04525 [Clostridia bacterium]|nr:hypothetical protein [Clostridia bacterium]